MRHFINGIEIAPKNLTEIGVVSTFTDDPDILSLSVDSVILPREGKDIVQNHIQNVGLFEGIPYSVQMDDGVTIEYYIDLLDGVKVRQHEIEVSLKKRKSKDNFFERASGSSFDLLKEKGVEFTSHDVPYFVIKDNQFETSLQLAIMTYIIGDALYSQALVTATAINNLVEVSAPIFGIAPITTPPFFTVTTSYNVAGIIAQSLNVVVQLIYYGLLIVLLIDLATQLILTIMPPKRKLKGTYVKEIMEKCCAYFGYTFASDLLDAHPYWAIVPVPLIKDRKSLWDILPDEIFPVFNSEVPSSSDTTPTIMTFIEGLETMFNARTIVRDSEVRLERRDWLQEQTSLQLEPALNLQSERDDEFSYNTEETWKRYYIHYQTDFQDLHTADGNTYDKSDTELSTEETFPVTNDDLVTIKGLNDVNIPFALGSRKDKLNWLEKSAKNVLGVIDTLTGIFGGGTNFEAQIDSRKDCLQISQQYFGVTKMIYGQSGAVKPGEIIQTESDFNNIVSAKSLWDKYHYINAIQNNDYIIRENVRIRISSSNFVSLLGNNYALIDGKLCEILRLEWIDEKSFAQISYKEPFDWADGKVQTIVIND
jgi:hypothetical protein